jgi:type IV secretory pathway VirB2 component (pilin)
MKKTILFVVLFLSLGAIFLLQSGISMAQSGENPLEGTSADEIMKNQANTTAKTSTAASPTTGGGRLENPLGFDNIEDVLKSIMAYLRGIAGTIAVIFIIIGGVMYMISGGNKEMTERAKKTVIFAMVGLAIVLAAPLFYQEIEAVLSGGSPGSALQELLGNILKLLLSIVGFLAIITMVVGSIWMFTAVGDDEKYELGKKTATYSIIGLVIAVASLVIATQVTNLIGNK